MLKHKVNVPIKIFNAPIANKPFETCSMDFVGPFITTDKGNKYILSIIATFPRFCILHAVPDKKTETVIDCLANTFDKFGYPETLISDNAMEFVSSAIQTFSRVNNIRKIEVLPYCAFSNGLCERNNSKINKLLKLYVNSHCHNNWDNFISTI